MVMKGFQLPAAFVELFRNGGFYANNRHRSHRVDAYGHRFEAQLQLYSDMSSIEWHNNHVEESWVAWDDPDVETPPGRPEDTLGFIPYIYDFSQIVCFGEGHEGSPYCFDYRENREKP